MVKIRLTRLGKHKSPFYRIVAVDSKCKRDGDFIELIGTVNPKDGAIKIDEKLTLELLNKGAQPSETIKNFLKQEGIWKKYLDSKSTATTDKKKPAAAKKEATAKRTGKKYLKLKAKKATKKAAPAASTEVSTEPKAE